MRTILLLLLLLALGAALPGCPSSETCSQNIASCPDAGDGSCLGQCVKPPVEGILVLLWSGPEGSTPPACPAWSMSGAFTGYLDAPPSTVKCSPACMCSSSFGSCAPGSMTANGAACPATTGQHQPFDAPATWDGSCTTMDAVASAASVTVAQPMVLSAGSCSPSVPAVQEFKGGATISVRCTVGAVQGACPELDEECGPPNVPGFKVCNLDIGEQDCPPTMPVRHLLFEKAEACACTCGAPTGETCTGTVTAYTDATCSMPAGSGPVSSAGGPGCFDVPLGSALGSKTASLAFEPGTCAATLTKTPPQTLCCLN
jgi:hypothetical protein